MYFMYHIDGLFFEYNISGGGGGGGGYLFFSTYVVINL